MELTSAMKFLAPLLFLATTFAALAEAPPLKVETPWVMAVPPVSSATAAFMTLVNEGKTPLTLTGASTSVAGMVMPMITTKKMVDGKAEMGMEDAKTMVIPAGGKLVLEPGGSHLMMMDLKQHPKAGDTVTITLQIQPGDQTVKIEAPVSLHEPKAAQ
jgi:copper(I)-binding protein